RRVAPVARLAAREGERVAGLQAVRPLPERQLELALRDVDELGVGGRWVAGLVAAVAAGRDGGVQDLEVPVGARREQAVVGADAAELQLGPLTGGHERGLVVLRLEQVADADAERAAQLDQGADGGAGQVALDLREEALGQPGRLCELLDRQAPALPGLAKSRPD